MRTNISKGEGIYVSCIVVLRCQFVLLVSPLRGDVRRRRVYSLFGVVLVFIKVVGSVDKVTPCRGQSGFRKRDGRC